MDINTSQAQKSKIASWAHAWSAAATQIYIAMENIRLPESPATEAGRRDALTMSLINAVRNVARGAELALGRQDPVIQDFKRNNNELTEIRDRFEHYEEYLLGQGKFQRKGHESRGNPLELDTDGLEIKGSRGGGPDGHVVEVVVYERDENDECFKRELDLPAKSIVIAARCLARDVLQAIGKLDNFHLQRCDICIDPATISVRGDD